MGAVGPSDVFKYGLAFFGYVLAVVLVGGSLVAGGAYVASLGGLTVTDPTVASLDSARAIAGVFLLLAGGLTLVAGIPGLVFKLLADAARVGVREAREQPEVFYGPDAATPVARSGHGATTGTESDASESDASVPDASESDATEPGSEDDGGDGSDSGTGTVRPVQAGTAAGDRSDTSTDRDSSAGPGASGASEGPHDQTRPEARSVGGLGAPRATDHRHGPSTEDRTDEPASRPGESPGEAAAGPDRDHEIPEIDLDEVTTRAEARADASGSDEPTVEPVEAEPSHEPPGTESSHESAEAEPSHEPAKAGPSHESVDTESSPEPTWPDLDDGEDGADGERDGRDERASADVATEAPSGDDESVPDDDGPDERPSSAAWSGSLDDVAMDEPSGAEAVEPSGDDTAADEPVDATGSAGAADGPSATEGAATDTWTPPEENDASGQWADEDRSDEGPSVRERETRLEPGDDVTEWGGDDSAADPHATEESRTSDDEAKVWTPPDPDEFERQRSAESSDAPADDGDGTWDDGASGAAEAEFDQASDEDVEAAAADVEVDAEDDADEDDADEDDADEDDEDETLADEGVGSFEVAGDEDPLADRLPGDES